LAFSIQPKVPELSKRAQLVPKFPGKVSRGKNRRMVELLNYETFNRKFHKLSEENEKEPKSPEKKKIGKLAYTSRGCPLFWKFRKMLFSSPKEIREIQTGTFAGMESALFR